MRTDRSTILVAFMLVLPSLALSACGDGCPEPIFAEPAIPDGIQSAPGGDDFVVVTWPASAGDELPDEYYAGMEPTELASGVSSVEHGAPRELTVALSNDVRSTPSEIEVRFRMDDTLNWADCSHPGSGDEYFVSLLLSFDGSGGVSPSFSEVGVSLGACAVSAPGRRSASSWWLVPLALGYLWHRRRRTVASSVKT